MTYKDLPRGEYVRGAVILRRNLEYTGGDILEKYWLGEELADTEHGGQGTLYRAKRREDGLDVVLKIYASHEKAEEWDNILNNEKRAGREIRFLERANNDCITGVPVLLEYGGTGGNYIKTPVAVLEALPGRTLEEGVMAPGHNPDMEEILRIAKGLAEVLTYAHDENGVKQIVHRDIKPENIFVNGGMPVLIDWAASTPTSGKTQFKTQMYSQYFTAPEVSNDNGNFETIDKRADIYSLGQVLKFTLLGDVFREVNGVPTQKDFEKLNVPKKLVKVLEKATQYNPDERYSTAREFYEALEIAAQGRSLAVVKTQNKTLEQITQEEQESLKDLKKGDLTAAGLAGGIMGGVAGLAGGIMGGVAGLVGGMRGSFIDGALMGTFVGLTTIPATVWLTGLSAEQMAKIVGLTKEEQRHQRRRGFAYGIGGIMVNTAQAVSLGHFYGEEALPLALGMGMAIQASATIITPLKILAEHYIGKMKQRRIEASEKGLVRKLADKQSDGFREVNHPGHFSLEKTIGMNFEKKSIIRKKKRKEKEIISKFYESINKSYD